MLVINHLQLKVKDNVINFLCFCHCDHLVLNKSTFFPNTDQKVSEVTLLLQEEGLSLITSFFKVFFLF